MDVEPSSFHKLIGQVEGATLGDDEMEIDCESVDIRFAMNFKLYKVIGVCMQIYKIKIKYCASLLG